jgi:hypothetical protein
VNASYRFARPPVLGSGRVLAPDKKAAAGGGDWLSRRMQRSWWDR